MLIANPTIFKIAGNVFPRLTSYLFIRWFKEFLKKPQIMPLREKDKEFLQTANQMQIKFKDIELASYNFGEGPLILVVHGIGGNTTNYSSIIPRLVQSGFKVVAFDWPSHGNSPYRSFERYELEELVPEMIQQCEQLHGIVGHSGGSAAIARALINCPETTRLKRLIQISPDPGGKDLIAIFLNRVGVPEKVAQLFFRWFESQINMPLEDSYIDKCLSRCREPNIPEVLTIHDKDDKVIPFSLISSRFEKNFDSELFVTEGLGHYKILRDVNVINKIVVFMNK